MEKTLHYPLSAHSDGLRRLISEVFVLSDYGALKGLPDRLKVLGHYSMAEALEQILENEITAPEIKPTIDQQSEIHGANVTVKPSTR